MELVTEYKDDMTKFIAGCVQTLQRTLVHDLPLTLDPDMAGPEQVIFRESVYNAVTLNALALYDLIDFDSWLTSVIPAELAYTGPQYLLRVTYLTVLVTISSVGEWLSLSANG
jgi:hypothetical protein